MAMVVVDASCLKFKQAGSRRAHSSSQVAWSECRRPLSAALHSPDESNKLSQWPRSWWQHYKYLHGYYYYYYYYYYYHHYPVVMLKVQLAPSHVMVMRRKLVVYCLQCTKFKSLSLIILPPSLLFSLIIHMC